MTHHFKQVYLFAMLVFIQANCYSQSQMTKKYRVTAYKFGNTSVFSQSNEAEVTPAMTFYIPNTFTPNGDGLNDTFGIVGEAIKEFYLVIYNRWGQKVFESSKVDIQWDGTFNGTISPQDSYSYTVLAQGPSGGRLTKKGTFNLIL